MDSMQRVLSYFREICSIPRRSGDESNVAQYLIETGKRLGLEVDQDSCGNVVLRKAISQATPPTILQAHMDMVWESTGTPYQKGVSLRETDECLHAVGSTLGADNGIGMALILALMEDDTVQNIEGLFTVDEETGMTGAKGLDASLVSGTRLINLDSETEGTFTISAAGGLNIILNASVECHKQSRFHNPKVLKLSVSGLKGGHSGLDIGTPHLNAIQILVRWLRSCPASNWELLELHGGTRSNAIPVCAEALIQVGDTSSEEEWKLAASAITAQAESVDHGILLQTSFEAPICKQAYTDSFCDQLLSTLAALPHGVLQRTPEIIQLSSNLATVRQLGDMLKLWKACVLLLRRCSAKEETSSFTPLTAHRFNLLSRITILLGNLKKMFRCTHCLHKPINHYFSSPALWKMFMPVLNAAFSRNVAPSFRK